MTFNPLTPNTDAWTSQQLPSQPAGTGSGPSTSQAAHVAAAAALTSSQNATANGSDATTTQALANALKVSYNAAQVDIAALRTKLNELIAALEAADLTAAS